MHKQNPTALWKDEGIIKGTVLDKNSGEPVIGAAVMLEQTLKGNNRHLQRELPDLTGGFITVHHRHIDIHQNQLRFVFPV